MHDKSTIGFTPESKALLSAKVAYVGDNCTIAANGSKGENGEKDTDKATGEDGGNLKIDVHFIALGSLTIDTRGGNGGNGYKGKNG
ncbi:hypothetical protein [Pontibacter chitinilyticus]|uniref:hypothetical protein n=1 Tax=Pontibacter chitinilyticus TaxID=2674989 RepID=UPI003218F33C